MRIRRDNMNMSIAQIVSLRSTCARRSVGCVIAREGRIISTGYNGAPSGLPHCIDVGCGDQADKEGCKRTVHAEAGAISFAAKHGVSLDGSTLYVTTSPCVECSKLIINAGIERVVYLIPYRVDDGLRLLQQAGLEVEKYGGPTLQGL